MTQPLTEQQTLMVRLRELGFKKSMVGMTIGQLRAKVNTLERVRDEGLSRLDFDANGVLLNNDNNRKIFASRI